MKSAGIDYSTKFGSIAVASDRELKTTSLWTPSSTKLSESARIMEWYRWACAKLAFIKPDVCAIEHLAVFQNKEVVRALSHFECAAIIAAKRVVPVVFSVRTTTARMHVYGHGNMSKDEAWKRRKKAFGSYDFGQKTTGGLDKMDAATLALAAPIELER
jgi:Holliday junction resolvasome RuvABC endonuclease subunit